jgi:uncharacterized protein (DUF2267 family)
MTATSLDVIDKTVHTTNLWLKEIAEAIGGDRRRAWHALGAVLRALRDRLTIGDSAHLAAQLPLLVRGLYFDQWRPAEQPVPVRKREEFLAMIRERLGDIGPIDPEDAARAVFTALDRHIAEGEIDKLLHVLPAELRGLWRPAAEGAP